MKPYLLSPTDRIRHWRDFRLTLTNDESDEDQILRVMRYWQQFPLVEHFLDIDRPKKWSTSWELIMGGDFCQSSLAYLMEQTLLMAFDHWDKDRLQLMFIDDKSKSKQLMILVIDNKYVVNYSYDEIIDFDFILKHCIIQHKYLMRDRFHVIK